MWGEGGSQSRQAAYLEEETDDLPAALGGKVKVVDGGDAANGLIGRAGGTVVVDLGHCEVCG